MATETKIHFEVLETGKSICGHYGDRTANKDGVTCGNCKRQMNRKPKVEIAHWVSTTGEPICGNLNSMNVMDVKEDVTCKTCIKVMNKPEKVAKPKVEKAPAVRTECLCGCGNLANPKRLFVQGHDAKLKGIILRWMKDNSVAIPEAFMVYMNEYPEATFNGWKVWELRDAVMNSVMN